MIVPWNCSHRANRPIAFQTACCRWRRFCGFTDLPGECVLKPDILAIWPRGWPGRGTPFRGKSAREPWRAIPQRAGPHPRSRRKIRGAGDARRIRLIVVRECAPQEIVGTRARFVRRANELRPSTCSHENRSSAANCRLRIDRRSPYNRPRNVYARTIARRGTANCRRRWLVLYRELHYPVR